jgi:hypothetical protein
MIANLFDCSQPTNSRQPTSPERAPAAADYDHVVRLLALA